MKRILIVVLTLLFTTTLFAQVRPVQNADSLQWDHPGDCLEYRVYIKEVANIIPDGTTYTAQVAAPNLDWVIDGLTHGVKYAVVTAYYDDPTYPVETGPSNEITFRVVGPPTNLRISDLSPAGNIVFFYNGFAAETEAEWLERIVD